VTLNKMSPDWFVAFLLIVAYSASTGKQLHGMLKLRMQEARMTRLRRRCGQCCACLCCGSVVFAPAAVVLCLSLLRLQ
jgi:hypothetical protein